MCHFCYMTSIRCLEQLNIKIRHQQSGHKDEFIVHNPSWMTKKMMRMSLLCSWPMPSLVIEELGYFSMKAVFALLVITLDQVSCSVMILHMKFRLSNPQMKILTDFSGVPLLFGNQNPGYKLCTNLMLVQIKYCLMLFCMMYWWYLEVIS